MTKNFNLDFKRIFLVQSTVKNLLKRDTKIDRKNSLQCPFVHLELLFYVKLIYQEISRYLSLSMGINDTLKPSIIKLLCFFPIQFSLHGPLYTF
jgi:hypothetical protein